MNTLLKIKQLHLIWGHTLVTLNTLETSSASKTGSITWVTMLSTQAIPATVVATVLLTFSYVTGYKNNAASYMYISTNIWLFQKITKSAKSTKIKQMAFVILRIQPGKSCTIIYFAILCQVWNEIHLFELLATNFIENVNLALNIYTT